MGKRKKYCCCKQESTLIFLLVSLNFITFLFSDIIDFSLILYPRLQGPLIVNIYVKKKIKALHTYAMYVNFRLKKVRVTNNLLYFVVITFSTDRNYQMDFQT